jgi:hypothetical protein
MPYRATRKTDKTRLGSPTVDATGGRPAGPVARAPRPT